MSEPFLAEVRIYGFSFAPRGWALCDGQIMPITQNPSLFSLLGSTYGGDGRITFGLPDLRGRVPIHAGDSPHIRGQRGGEETHSLSTAEIPQHSHDLKATNDAATWDQPENQALATASDNMYAPLDTMVAMNPGTVAHVGGGQAHNNMMPYTTLNFCIAIQGQYPPRS